MPLSNMPISVYRLCEMPTHSCGQSVSAPRGKACAMLNAHTELQAERQRSAREAIYRKRRIDSLSDCGVRPYSSGAQGSTGPGGG